MMTDRAIARIRAYRRFKGWSLTRLAGAAGMSESTIRHLDAPDWSPTADTMRRLEAVIPSEFEAAEAAS